MILAALAEGGPGARLGGDLEQARATLRSNREGRRLDFMSILETATEVGRLSLSEYLPGTSSNIRPSLCDRRDYTLTVHNPDSALLVVTDAPLTVDRPFDTSSDTFEIGLPAGEYEIREDKPHPDPVVVRVRGESPGIYLQAYCFYLPDAAGAVLRAMYAQRFGREVGVHPPPGSTEHVA